MYMDMSIDVYENGRESLRKCVYMFRYTSAGIREMKMLNALVFGFEFVMQPHRWQSSYNRNAYKWCAVIGKPGSARPNRTALPQWTLDTRMLF